MGVQNPEQYISSFIHPKESPAESTSVVHSSSSSAGQCLEFESPTSLSTSACSSDYDVHMRLYETIEGLQKVESSKPKKRRWKRKRKARRSSCNKSSAEKKGENVCGGCAASFAADCAAICCCCPCALLHLLILAFVKLPSVFARKAVRFVKKKSEAKRNDNDVDDDGDEKRETFRYYTPPWSCTGSPQRRSLEAPTFHTHNVWSELYAAGYMGFGGLPFERN